MKVSSQAVAKDGVGAVALLNSSGRDWEVVELNTRIEGVPQQQLAWSDVYFQAASRLARNMVHIDHTATAAQDHSEVNFTLSPGDQLIAVYSGIDEGAVCEFSLTTSDDFASINADATPTNLGGK